MINIVMLVKDRPELTRQALESLIANTITPANLTIVDDESEHLIADSGIFDCFAATILMIRRSKGITGQARNLGVYWAEKYWGRGDWLYLSDNDVYFTERWDLKLVRAARLFEPGLRLLGGATHPFHGTNQAIAQDGWIDNLQWQAKVHTHDAVSGYSQLMRWKTWDEYGPLAANAPGVAQSEDWAFCQEIIKDGGLVGSIYPEVVYDCGLTNTFGEPTTGAGAIIRRRGILQL
ncbi:MAG: glycosyltransferase family 2 protein [Acidobacteriota bacterium]